MHGQREMQWLVVTGCKDRSVRHPALRGDLSWERIRLVLACPGAVEEHVCLVPALGLSLAAAALWGCEDRAWLGGEGSRMRLYPTHCSGTDLEQEPVLQNFLCPVPEADSAFRPCLDVVSC